MARNTLENSDSPSSEYPPRYPALTPTSTDIAVAMSPARKPTSRVARADQSNCDQTSWAYSVVPSQWVLEGENGSG